MAISKTLEKKMATLAGGVVTQVVGDTTNVIGQARPSLDKSWEGNVIAFTGGYRIIRPKPGSTATWQLFIVPIVDEDGRTAEISFGSLKHLDLAKLEGQEITYPLLTIKKLRPVLLDVGHARYSSTVEGKTYPKGLKPEVEAILDKQVDGDITQYLDEDFAFNAEAFILGGVAKTPMPVVTIETVEAMSSPGQFTDMFLG